MRGHIDAETLAAYREGLLPRRRARRVSAHLPGCPRCAETDAQLAGVTTVLASTPVPPMPAALAGRIEAALAAEAASRAEAAGHTTAGLAAATGDGGRAGHDPLGGHLDGDRAGARGGRVASEPRPGGARRRPGGRSWLTLRVAAAAAAVAIIAGGGYGLSQLPDHGGTAASGASGKSASRHATSGTGQGSAASRTRTPTNMAPAEASNGLPVVSSGTRYQPGQLGSQAKAVLTRYGGLGGAAVPRAKIPRPAPSAGFSDLSACVHRVSGGRTPTLVDLASYQGQRVAVIMIPAAKPEVRVLVVGAGCTASTSDVLARSLISGSG